jgi:transporter family-2 protein
MKTAITGIAVLIGGAGLALQFVWNAKLREFTGSTLLAALVSLGVSMALLGILWVAGIAPRGTLPSPGNPPAWSWMGGAFAVYFLIVAMLALPRLGTSGVVLLAVAGQLAAGLILDATGAFGVPRIPLDGFRIMGAVLVMAGAILTHSTHP